MGGDLPSAWVVEDCVLSTPATDRRESTRVRTHNAIDRHTGSVRDGGLFSIETLVPGTTGTLRWTLHADDDGAEVFLQQLVGLLEAGLAFGGHSARGIGVARLAGKPRIQRYDLSTASGLAAWLDRSYSERVGAPVTPLERELLPVAAPNVLRIQFRLGIPRGQDFCIGDGVGLDHAIEPQRTVGADGKEHLILPGSSLRGVLRGWISRLAAREGLPVADSAERHRNLGSASGADVGWGFDDPNERTRKARGLAEGELSILEAIDCPVMRLFGSLYSAGRIRVEDAISSDALTASHTQTRMHVAIDRITGGANDGFLFDHSAAISGAHFTVRVTVQDPEEREARWIAESLEALDLGVLRVGCSKSSGHLALEGRVDASGPHAQAFEGIVPSFREFAK
jgi:CRISPR/Cas system CSM-associated protein Csm3 (group 7 of RAMP superfamily)